MKMLSVDTLFYNGPLLTMKPGQDVIERGALAVKGDTIVAVGSSDDLLKQYNSAIKIDVAGSLLMPGLINGHTHAGMTLMRGLVDDMALKPWLQRLWKIEQASLDDAFVYWSTMLACYEMVCGGVTTYVDTYYYVDASARVAEKMGIRAVVGQTVIDEFPMPGSSSLDELFVATEDYIRRWKGHALVTPAVGPHALYTCTPTTLRRCQELAEKYDIPVLLHLAETCQENETSLRRYGKRSIELLAAEGLLSQRLIAAHCVDVTEHEITLLRDAGVRVVHNPSSNMKLGVGVAPLCAFIEQGIVVGLGTDSAVSNNALNIWAEAKQAALLQKVVRGSDALDAYTVLEMATIRGAQAIGCGDTIGSLEVGKKADIIVVSQHRFHQMPIYSIPSQLVYASRSSDVETVMINGKLIMKDKVILAESQTHELEEKMRFYKQRVYECALTLDGSCSR